MPADPAVPPTPALAELAAILGPEDTRDLVRTFLGEFPAILRGLQTGSRAEQHRLAHALKSSARHMGADTLADRSAALELRLAAPDGALTPADLPALAAEFERLAPALRRFAGAA